MTKVFIKEIANIDLCPTDSHIPFASDLTIGDMHANPIAFLYFLIRHGIYSITPKNYARLVDIYKTPLEHISKEGLAEFNTLIDGMEIKNRDALIRLIGDETADRGVCDYYILKILHKLKKDDVKVSILASNHGAVFVEAYECFIEKENRLAVTTLSDEHAASLIGLQYLIDRKIISAEDIFSMIETSYKPALNLLGYSLDTATNGMTLFSHAAIGIQSIQAAAIKFRVNYKDGTNLELANTIDRINEAFSIVVRDNNVHTLLSDMETYRGYRHQIVFNLENAIEFILWNRRYAHISCPEGTYLTRPPVHYGYSLDFVHGHDNEEPTRGNIYVLDNTLGKFPTHHTGHFLSLISDERQVPLHIAMTATPPGGSPLTSPQTTSAMLPAMDEFLAAMLAPFSTMTDSPPAPLTIPEKALPPIATGSLYADRFRFLAQHKPVTDSDDTSRATFTASMT